MKLILDVDPTVAQAWNDMAMEMGMDMGAFVRSCVRTAGPRLVEAYGVVIEPQHCPIRESRRQSVIAGYRARLREDQP